MQTENQERGCELSLVSRERLARHVKLPTLVRKEREDWGTRPVSEEHFDIQAVGLDSGQRYGDVAEARFVAKAASLGFGVSKPWGNERYDFILDSGYCFWRVQVKSTWARTKCGYVMTVGCGSLVPYKDTEIDFLAGYVAPEDAWYIIPVRLVKKRTRLCLHPQGNGRSKWEKLREGWCQMACPHDENGPSKIVTSRCRDQGPVQMAICPLKALR